MPLVVDASIALAWAFARREQRLLNIAVEESATALAVIRDGGAAALRYGLTAYDAAYVDLAAREGLPLATLDTAMR
jgi:predicted nucleic acid-binding protein